MGNILNLVRPDCGGGTDVPVKIGRTLLHEPRPRLGTMLIDFGSLLPSAPVSLRYANHTAPRRRVVSPLALAGSSRLRVLVNLALRELGESLVCLLFLA